MVQLQRQLPRRLHLEGVDLKPLPVLDAVVAAPGTEHLAMQRVLVAPELLQASDEFLHIVHAIARRDEDCVLGLDHDGVLKAYGRDEAALGVEIATR